MNRSNISLLRRWIVFWDVVLAAAAGLVVFAMLDMLSSWLLVSTVTVAAALAVGALFHFLTWGRAFERQTQPMATKNVQAFQVVKPPDVFSLELTDAERIELLNVLQEALAHTPPKEGKTPQEALESAATRRELLDRLRMFGA